MWQRFKDVVDARIAEEQARQKQAGAPSSPRTRPRAGSRAVSPSRRKRRDDGADKLPLGKGPDPSEFEPDFVIGDSEAPTRTGTPILGKPAVENLSSNGNDDGSTTEDKEKGAEETGETKPSAAVELPPEIQQRLKKLDRLEPKYAELLRSYRVAHARISAIEPFEATLRENTSLTSINDPGALVEYLQQNNLKTNMVMDELKRIYAERDEMKSKLEEAEQSSKSAREELQKLRSQPDAKESGKDILASIGAGDTTATSAEAETQMEDDSEDFFSYESELPRLQDEVKQYEGQVTKLKAENTTLKSNLASANESAEQLVRNLETSTKQLASLRESKQAFEIELQNERQQHEDDINDIKSKLEKAEKDLEVQRSDAEKYLQGVKELEDKLTETTKELETVKSTVATQNDRSEQLGLEKNIRSLQSELEESRSARAQQEKRSETLNNLVQTLRAQIQQAQQTVERSTNGTDSEELKAAGTMKPDAAAGGKKKNKKKKKGGKAAESESSKAAEIDTNGTTLAVEELQESTYDTKLDLLQQELASLHDLCADKDASIRKLESKLKDQEALQEEIESLRDDLVNIGQGHVEAKDKIKGLLAEKSALQESIDKLDREAAELRNNHESHTNATQAHQSLTADFQDLKSKCDTLEIDLAAAQKLAASRFKDLSDLREIMQKAQPELTSLRAEVALLRRSKEELASKISDVKKLELREKELKAELVKFKKQVSEKDADIRSLNEKGNQLATQRREAEEASRKMQRDLQRAQNERRDALDSKDKLAAELAKAQEELQSTKAIAQRLEQQVGKLNADAQSVRDEIALKTAQYASAQSLMNSMQDQTQELGAQMKETKERCESLEEELADAHRLLSERSREFDTMRRLLADVDGRADSRIKEMRERMDLATEERDRAEEQASAMGRKRSRELEELKSKVRDAERALSKAVQQKEDAESSESQLRKQKNDLEQRSTRTNEEISEVREAMAQLRDALDETEKQVRDLEKEKVGLKNSLDETQQRLEKVQKSSKSMAEELKGFTHAQSSRSSLESSQPISRLASPPPRSTLSPGPAGSIDQAGKGKMDYVYLKNVLLQFLEQKDKKHQMQLVPVLGMLLHFDRQDEQKWMSAIKST